MTLEYLSRTFKISSSNAQTHLSHQAMPWVEYLGTIKLQKIGVIDLMTIKSSIRTYMMTVMLWSMSSCFNKTLSESERLTSSAPVLLSDWHFLSQGMGS